MIARVVVERGLVYVEAPLAQLQAAGLLTWWPRSEGEGRVVKMACAGPYEAAGFAFQINNRRRANPPP